MSYDPGDPESILSHATELEGNSLRDVLAAEIRTEYGAGKGGLGQLVESAHFGYKPNSTTAADFEAAGVELKTFPVHRLKNGALRPKERLSLSIIDYRTISSETWKSSTFLRKNARILLLTYFWEPNTDPLDYRFLTATLWTPAPEDLAVIRGDWEYIVSEIRAGRAHLLSEGDTMYLSACTKGATAEKSYRRQPFSPERAKQRAFAYKQSYMRQVLDPDPRLQSVATPEKHASVEETILRRFEPFVGLTDSAIAAQLGIDTSRRPKGLHASLTKGILGVGPTNRAAELEKSNTTTRTLRVGGRGLPREEISFPAFEYVDLVTQEWETCDFREQLMRRFLFVVYRARQNSYVLESVHFWNMPESDVEGEARQVWRTTVDSIREGRAEALPRKSDGNVAHVRPHGRDSSDRLPTPQGDMLVRKSFWLNRDYVARQIGLTN